MTVLGELMHLRAGDNLSVHASLPPDAGDGPAAAAAAEAALPGGVRLSIELAMRKRKRANDFHE
jgi:hypothetical protein